MEAPAFNDQLLSFDTTNGSGSNDNLLDILLGDSSADVGLLGGGSLRTAVSSTAVLSKAVPSTAVLAKPAPDFLLSHEEKTRQASDLLSGMAQSYPFGFLQVLSSVPLFTAENPYYHLPHFAETNIWFQSKFSICVRLKLLKFDFYSKFLRVDLQYHFL